MQDRVWKIIATVMCAGLFYIGHGLHSPRDAGLSSLENVAHAGGVAWHPESPEMFTVREDGRTVYTWKRFKDVREGKIVVQYIGRTDAPSEPGDRRFGGPRIGGGFPGQRPILPPVQQPVPVPAERKEPIDRKQN